MTPTTATTPAPDLAPAPAAPTSHWRALDGLRALAVLAVLFLHLGVLAGGYLGVDMFFVLSGFLITFLLISEWDKRGSVSFRNFYIRRVLRLFPALACVLITSVLLAWLLDAAGGAIGRELAAQTFSLIPWAVAFVANWARALGPPALLNPLGPIWSLSIEEQFYLLWPLLLATLLRRRLSRARLALLLAVLAVAEMAYRVALARAGNDRIYYGTDTHSDGLLIGCALALWLASGQPSRLPGWLVRATAWLAAATLTVLLVLGNVELFQYQVPAAVIATGVIVAAVTLQAAPAAMERLLCSRWAVFFGRRSYGLYIWQAVIFVPAYTLYVRWSTVLPRGERLAGWTVLPGVAAVACLLVVELSYRFVELPALRLKRRFRA
jgi:peptidoglycan/LPS O-acetylase OafA/YrhL